MCAGARVPRVARDNTHRGIVIAALTVYSRERFLLTVPIYERNPPRPIYPDCPNFVIFRFQASLCGRVEAAPRLGFSYRRYESDGAASTQRSIFLRTSVPL